MSKKEGVIGMLMVAHVGEGGVKIGQKRAHVVYGRSLSLKFAHVFQSTWLSDLM